MERGLPACKLLKSAHSVRVPGKAGRFCNYLKLKTINDRVLYECWYLREKKMRAS